MKSQTLTLAAVMLVASPIGQAQEACDLTPSELIAEAFKLRSVDLGLYTEPLQSPPASQVAPSQAAATDDPVPDPSFPALFAMHLGVPSSTSESGAVTFNFTPFAIVAARNPDVIDQQVEYEKRPYEKLRKVGLGLTLGGTGEAFDRDDDGDVDDARESASLDDIVSVELRYRFAGSRDRRDASNAKKYFQKTRRSFDDAADAFAGAGAPLVQTVLSSIAPAAGSAADNPRYCKADALALLAARAKSIDAQVATVASFMKQRREVLESIDGATVWSFVAGLTQRKTDFGSDVWTAGVRGSSGLGPNMGFNFNLDYGVTDTPGTAGDANRIKGGLEWAVLLGKNRVGGDGVRASLSGSYEKWKDVQDSQDDEVGKLNFKLNFPLTGTISIPLSVTWANKTDLLKDESEIRGYIGFTFDFDGALRKALLGPQ